MLEKMIFNNSYVPVLTKSLDACMMRSRTIANNIANVNTPGYQRLEVSFEDELKKSLNGIKLKGTRTDEGHLELGKKSISELRPQVERPIDPTMPSGVNNVDIDTEMAKLAENQILYNFGANMLRGAMRKINSAIQGKSLPVQ